MNGILFYSFPLYRNILNLFTSILMNFSCNANYDLLYVGHLFLVYTSQVYFGYKLREFLYLPITEKIIEHGFYLLGRWWSPADDTSYWDMSESLLNQY